MGSAQRAFLPSFCVVFCAIPEQDVNIATHEQDMTQSRLHFTSEGQFIQHQITLWTGTWSHIRQAFQKCCFCICLIHWAFLYLCHPEVRHKKVSIFFSFLRKWANVRVVTNRLSFQLSIITLHLIFQAINSIKKQLALNWLNALVMLQCLMKLMIPLTLCDGHFLHLSATHMSCWEDQPLPGTGEVHSGTCWRRCFWEERRWQVDLVRSRWQNASN